MKTRVIAICGILLLAAIVLVACDTGGPGGGSKGPQDGQGPGGPGSGFSGTPDAQFPCGTPPAGFSGTPGAQRPGGVGPGGFSGTPGAQRPGGGPGDFNGTPGPCRDGAGPGGFNSAPGADTGGSAAQSPATVTAPAALPAQPDATNTGSAPDRAPTAVPVPSVQIPTPLPASQLYNNPAHSG